MHRLALIWIISAVLLTGCNIGEVTPPIIISSIQVSDITATTATISFTTGEQSTTKIDYADDTYYTANSSYNQLEQTSDYVTSHSITLSDLSPATTYHYRITTTDSDSNESTASDRTFTTRPLDSVAPVLSNPTPPPSSILAAGTISTTLSVATDEPAVCRYSTTANTAYDAMPNSFTNDASSTHSTTITGLANGNDYTYHIRCQDTSNNVNDSDYTISFSVASSGGGASNQDPVLDFIPAVSVTEGDNVTLNPSATDPDNDTLSFSYTGWMTSNTRSTQLGDVGTYTVTVTVTDGKGGSDSQDVTVTVNEATATDVEPPVRSQGAPTGIQTAGTSSVTLSITTDEYATCRYSETENTDYASMNNTFSTTGANSHSSAINDLADGNSYTYYVRCQDSSNNANTTDYPISFSVASSGEVPQTDIPAFPGAQGFGSSTVGGRGGTVVKVTNLDDTGPGSFRAAVTTNRRHYATGSYSYESDQAYHDRLEADGHRIVVFEVSGIINLKTEIMIKVPYLTIAGETSPGGILITGRQVSINTHNVIMRHMRFRVGSHRITDGTNADPETLDSFDLYGNAMMNWFDGPGASDVIIDHCSFSWGVDETFTAATGANNFTVQWSIFSEGLSNAGHPKGEHSKGVLLSLGYGGVNNVSFHHNYLVSNRDRNPLMSGEGTGAAGEQWADIRNNVIYNFYGALSMSAQGNAAGNWVHNYVKLGPESNSTAYEMAFLNPVPDANHLLYVEGNLGVRRTSQSDPQWVVGDHWYNSLITTDYQKAAPYDISGGEVSTEIASLGMAENILDSVGATQPVRDSVDARVIADFYAGTGAIIDNVDFPGDFPTFEDLTPPADSDNDGMPDSWETTQGFNTSIDDSASDNDSDGYTNIEEYLHYAAANGPVSD